jgi:hemerythrin
MQPHRPPIQPPAYGAALRHARRQLCTRLAQVAVEPDECFAHDFVELVAEVEAHLRHEETVMEACHVKRLEERVHEQREENATILAALHRLIPEVEDGELELARQLVGALCDILSLHRIITDLALPHRLPLAAGPPRMRGRVARGPHPTCVARSRHTEPH